MQETQSQGFNSCTGMTPWRRKCQPTQVFLPEKFHGQRNLAGCSPWVHKESDTTVCTHTHTIFNIFKRMMKTQNRINIYMILYNKNILNSFNVKYSRLEVLLVLILTTFPIFFVDQQQKLLLLCITG